MRKTHSLLQFATYLQLLCCLLFLLGTAGTIHAQVAGTANLQGTVADSTGAVIPNATVTITNLSTQVKHTAKSDSSGVYAFPNIDIGNYTVDVDMPGFKSYEQKGVVLEVGSSIAVNVNMAVGSTDEKVEVTATGLALQTRCV